jgi:hypothetical protein
LKAEPEKHIVVALTEILPQERLVRAQVGNMVAFRAEQLMRLKEPLPQMA